MKITEVKKINNYTNKLDNDYIKYLENNDVWWITKNRLYINLDNSSDKDIKKILFRLSDMDCNNKSNKTLYLNFNLYETLMKFDHEVYVGELPFDYLKMFSKGKKCGVIESASF
ncbi:MAG: hypothetical protein KGI13_08755 [Betaproteobacteria bacterium]|nr:hypothetical protein [Betaproteobacteria bacterium]